MRNYYSRIVAASLLLLAATFSPASARNLDQQGREFYGYDRATSTTEKDFTVGTTPVQILRNDPSRFEDIESDTGASNCALGRTGAVTITAGVLLGANGGSYNETWIDDSSLPGLEMWAVCSAAGGTIHVVEQKWQ